MIKGTGGGLNVPLMFHGRKHIFNNMMPHDIMNKLSYVNGIYQYHNDFVEYNGPATAGSSNGWILTETAGGSGNAQSVSLRPGVGGILRLLTDDGDNDAELLQRNVEDFKFLLGKQAGFFVRFAPGDADDGEIHVGLNITDTSPIASEPTDGLYFHKAETATKMSFSARKDGTSTTKTNINSAAMADDTFECYGFLIAPSGQINIYHGATFQSMQYIDHIAAGDANIPDDEDLALAFGFQTGAAAAKYLDIDLVAYFREL